MNIDTLKKLSKLKDENIITEEEFDEQKRKIMNQCSSEENKKNTNINVDKIILVVFVISFALLPTIISKFNNDNEDSSLSSAILKKNTAEIIDNTVRIIEQYDLQDLNSHSLLGVVENKTSDSISVSIQINYYNAKEIKVGDSSDYVTVDPFGKAKFQTMIFYDSFDHYRVTLKYYPLKL